MNIIECISTILSNMKAMEPTTSEELHSQRDERTKERTGTRRDEQTNGKTIRIRDIKNNNIKNVCLLCSGNQSFTTI